MSLSLQILLFLAGISVFVIIIMYLEYKENNVCNFKVGDKLMLKEQEPWDIQDTKGTILKQIGNAKVLLEFRDGSTKDFNIGFINRRMKLRD